MKLLGILIIVISREIVYQTIKKKYEKYHVRDCTFDRSRVKNMKKRQI